MDEHTLPSDPAEWPRNPYRLLGVEPGVSERDLKRAYLRLVRQFKPEQAPEQFRLIRAAYESLQDHASHEQTFWPPAQPAPLPRPPRAEAPGDSQPTEEAIVWEQNEEGEWVASGPWADESNQDDRASAVPLHELWHQACAGALAEVYPRLRQRVGNPLDREEACLQLYWLLTVEPALDPHRLAADWLVDALRATGGRSLAARELLRRAVLAQPDYALSSFAGRLLSPEAPLDLVLAFAAWRWRAARLRGDWRRIIADINALRPRVECADAAIWTRLLIAAASQLAWAPDAAHKAAAVLRREAESNTHLHRELNEELHQLDYLFGLTDGWRPLSFDRGLSGALYRLLPWTWDSLPETARPLVEAFACELAQQPVPGLAFLDRLRTGAPAVLGHLGHVLLQLSAPRAADHDDDDPFADDPEAPATFVLTQLGARRLPDDDNPLADSTLAPACQGFFSPFAGWTYSQMRPHLLKFCVDERISPESIVLLLTERPEGTIACAAELATSLDSDWPLRCLYQATVIAAA